MASVFSAQKDCKKKKKKGKVFASKSLLIRAGTLRIYLASSIGFKGMSGTACAVHLWSFYGSKKEQKQNKNSSDLTDSYNSLFPSESLFIPVSAS